MSIIVKNSDLDFDHWSHFTLNHPDANVFHSPEMFDAFKETNNYFPQIWYATDKNHNLLAIFPFVNVFVNTKFSKFTGRSISYGGFLSQPSYLGKAALTQIFINISQIKPYPTVFTEIRNCFNTSFYHEACIRSGFIYEDYLNFIINLDQPLDTLLLNIGKNTRKKIRKHLRNRYISFETVKHIDQIEDCYNVLLKTYKFNHVPLADIALFKSAFKILYPKNMIRAVLAKFEGRNIATFIDLMYKDKIYGWYGGFDRDFRNMDVNENIYWNLIEWGASNGYKWLDFGGAGRPNQKYGVRDFKAKFGGELVNWGRYTYAHHPVLYKLGKFGYRIYQRGFFND